MTLRVPRAPRALGAGLLGLALAAGLAPAASAGTTLESFVSVASTDDSCQSTVVTQITGSPGVRYYSDGHRLHLPTEKFRYDETGAVELTAKARSGATLDRYRYRVLAPAACFGNITVDSLPRYRPTVSWCTSSTAPTLDQAFISDENVSAEYTLVRRSSYREVASGRAVISAGEGVTTFAVPAGLPRGRYLLEARDPAAALSLYPWSMWVEELRCIKQPIAAPGKVTFRIPKNGPAARLSISVPSELDPVAVVRVRAGDSYTFHTDEPEVRWSAAPTGDHIGLLGEGSTAVPPC